MKCYQCPRCQNKVHPLASSQKNPTNLPMLSWTCFGCGWNSVDSGLMAENREELLGRMNFNLVILQRKQKRELQKEANDRIKPFRRLPWIFSRSWDYAELVPPPTKCPFRWKRRNRRRKKRKRTITDGMKWQSTFSRKSLTISSLFIQHLDRNASYSVDTATIKEVACFAYLNHSLWLVILLCTFFWMEEVLMDRRLGNGNWFRKGCFAMYALPVITLVQKKENSTVLRIRNVYSFVRIVFLYPSLAPMQDHRLMEK